MGLPGSYFNGLRSSGLQWQNPVSAGDKKIIEKGIEDSKGTFDDGQPQGPNLDEVKGNIRGDIKSTKGFFG